MRDDDRGSTSGTAGSPADARAGFVLPVVLVCLVVMTVLAHGTFLMARHQAAASDAAALGLRARLAAEAGVRLGAVTLRGDSLDAGPMAEGSTVDVGPVPAGAGTTARARVARVAPEWLWVEGAGTAGSARRSARRRVSRLYWRLDPAARVAAIRAVVEHGGPLETAGAGGLARSGRVAPPPDWPAALCVGLRSRLESWPAFAGWRARARLTDAGAEAPSDPGGEGSPEPSGPSLDRVPSLGLFDGAALGARADLRVEAESVTPTPPADPAVCIEADPPGWGAPSDPAGPCGARRLLIVRAGSLVLEGGEGQGILVVDGDLELRDGARFTGLVLVGGVLRVETGARLEGAARVGGGVRIGDEGRIVGSPCAVYRMLDARPLPRGPVLPPDASWIPLR